MANEQPAFEYFLTLVGKTFICNLPFASCLIPLSLYLCCCLFSHLCISFAMAVFAFPLPEEPPPPRPPQPAVLIKSKSGFSQQLLTHCSCPLCSLLAPLLTGTCHAFCSLPFFAVIPPSTFVPFFVSLFSIFPTTSPL